MFQKQNGRCAICRVQFSKLPKKPHVDHSHVTGQVRGLLCGRCNQRLGMLGDEYDVVKQNIEQILQYLQ